MYYNSLSLFIISVNIYKQSRRGTHIILRPVSMKNSKSKLSETVTNPFLIKLNNDSKIEQSVRLMEYINMYNLKKDQILYQCPIFKSNPADPEFDAEVACVNEMADVQIIYSKQRKQELSKLRREQQKLQAQRIEREKSENKGFKGIVSKLFGSKSKQKNNSSNLSPSKLKIDASRIKSSTYIARQQKKQENLDDKKLVQSVFGNASTAIKQQNFISETKPQNNYKKTQEVKDKPQKLGNNEFGNQILDYFDQNLLDAVEESVINMSKIEQVEQQINSMRDSKVTRVLFADEQSVRQSQKIVGRESKRSKRVDSDDEVDQKQGQNKSKQENQPSNNKQQDQGTRVSKKNSAKDSIKQQKVNPFGKTKSIHALSQAQNMENNVQGQNVLQKYIQQQISRVSSVNGRNEPGSSMEYSMLSSNDVMTASEHIQDSFSDIKIDWMVKIEACEMRERLLLNRLKQRWNQPMHKVGKIRNLMLQQITPQVNVDPRLRWAKSNLNFGKIIQ